MASAPGSSSSPWLRCARGRRRTNRRSRSCRDALGRAEVRLERVLAVEARGDDLDDPVSNAGRHAPGGDHGTGDQEERAPDHAPQKPAPEHCYRVTPFRSAERVRFRLQAADAGEWGPSGQFRRLLDVYGAGGRTRTDDLLITNQLLYQLSYAGRLVGVQSRPSRSGRLPTLPHARLSLVAVLCGPGPKRVLEGGQNRQVLRPPCGFLAGNDALGQFLVAQTRRAGGFRLPAVRRGRSGTPFRRRWVPEGERFFRASSDTTCPAVFPCRAPTSFAACSTSSSMSSVVRMRGSSRITHQMSIGRSLDTCAHRRSLNRQRRSCRVPSWLSRRTSGTSCR